MQYSVFAGWRQRERKIKANVLHSIVNIYVTPKYEDTLFEDTKQFTQRFIKHEDRKVLPSARSGLAEHKQIIYR